MSDHILSQIGEADEMLHTQHRDGLQVNRDLYSFQANEDKMKIVRTNSGAVRHAEM